MPLPHGNEHAIDLTESPETWTEVLEGSSDGLALQGIFLTGKPEHLLKRRLKMINVPNKCRWSYHENEAFDLFKFFDSHTQEQMAAKLIENGGYSVYQEMVADLDAASSPSYYEDLRSGSTKEEDMSYMCEWKRCFIPVATCTFTWHNLFLSSTVITDLKKLESLIGEEQNKQCKTILKKYGSHANTTCTFGGATWMKVESTQFSEEEIEMQRQLVEEIIDGEDYFLHNTNLSKDPSTYENQLVSKYDEHILKNLTFYFQTEGGPSDSPSLDHWRAELLSTSRSWKLIDRGRQHHFIPMWTIMVWNHREDFKDYEKVANTIKRYWEKETGLEDRGLEVESLMKAETIVHDILERAKEWTGNFSETFSEKCTEYITECLKAYFQVKMLQGTDSDYYWYQNVICNKDMQAFLKWLAYSIENSQLTSSHKTALLEQVLNLFGKHPMSDRSSFPGIDVVLSIITKYLSQSIPGELESFQSVKLLFSKIRKQASEVDPQKKGAQEMFMYVACILLLRLKELVEGIGQQSLKPLITALFYPYIASGEVLQKKGLSQSEWQSIAERFQKLGSYLDEHETNEQIQTLVFVTALTGAGEDLNSPDKREEMTGLLKALVEEMGPDLCPTLHKVVLDANGNVNQDYKGLLENITSIREENSVRKEMWQRKSNEIVQLVFQSKHKAPQIQQQRVVKKNNIIECLDLEKYCETKLSITDIKMVGSLTLLSSRPSRFSDVPWYFIQKLTMVHSDAIKVKCEEGETSAKLASQTQPSERDLEDLFLTESENLTVLNPLDVILAVFMCSDMFVQQELALKMSMCQYAVPILLPSCGKQGLFLLWGLRSIVKKWHQKSLNGSSCTIEQGIATHPMHTVTFIRFGKLQSSKSAFLNCLLSTSHNSHSFFVHSEMEGGEISRQISNGLVELSWYLPSGNENLDVFHVPFAIMNLRGDAMSFPMHVKLLASVSSVLFVFVDNIGDEEEEMIANLTSKVKLFLLLNPQTDKMAAIKQRLVHLNSTYNMKASQILLRMKKNKNEYVSEVHSKITNIQASEQNCMSLEEMSRFAREHGFEVDEDYGPCQGGRKKAEEVLADLSCHNITEFKQVMFPFQGPAWQEYSKIEKESLRLKDIGCKNTLDYSRELNEKKKQIRLKYKNDITPAMKIFVETILGCAKEEQLFFLQWMKLKLDSLSSTALPELREQLKMADKDLNEQNQLLEKLTSSSLGLEHFLREIGQIYEAFLMCDSRLKEDLHHLPATVAEILLAGFPVELIDGNVCNIPMRWVSDILNEVNKRTHPDTRIFVLSVLGVQSSGKSTLLNTLFGLQFAVSAGRCTQGAFMQLIHVDPDVKPELGCDYIMVIDTEGLKSQELMSLTDNYERDNEMATMIAALSDITLVNLASESSAEMQDVLQIVIHALIRMKETGKKPSIYFIHQNVADISAKEMNLLGTTQLLNRLNAVTQAAAKQEKKEGVYCEFSDVIQCDPGSANKYIAGLWHGVPPMAAVNVGYSESVFQLKKELLNYIKEQKKKQKPSTISDFVKWMEDVSVAVKSEDFLFSFQNSLEAAAFAKLDTHYRNWIWEIQQRFMEWWEREEVKIKNCEEPDDLLSKLSIEVEELRQEQEDKALDNLQSYFKKDIDNKQFIENRKHYFETNIKTTCQQLKDDSIKKCEGFVENLKRQDSFRKIHKECDKNIQTRVKKLLKKCKEEKKELSDRELTQIFDEMWKETVCFFKCPEDKVDVHQDMEKCLLNDASQRKDLKCKLKDGEHYSTGGDEFKVLPVHSKMLSTYGFYSVSGAKMANVQETANSIIKQCKKYIEELVDKDTDYDKNYCSGVIVVIDKEIEKFYDEKRKLTDQFCVDLKLHICAIAERQFQEMHNRFIQKNNILARLEEEKAAYCEILKDLFQEGDLSQKLAKRFCSLCLKPSLEGTVLRQLSKQVTTNMREKWTPYIFENISYFQLTLLIDVYKRDSFDAYKNFITDYDEYALDWLEKQANEYCRTVMNGKVRILSLAEEMVHDLCSTVTMTLSDILTMNLDTAEEFLQKLISELELQMVIQKDKADIAKFGYEVNAAEFGKNLQKAMESLAGEMLSEFGCWNMEFEVRNLPSPPPHKQLFTLLRGCGEKCPFCGVPCELEGSDHQHYARYHRVLGVSHTPPDMLPFKTTMKKHYSHMFENSDERAMNCISPTVQMKRHQGRLSKRHKWGNLYKGYTSIYWRFVLKKYNQQFAELYKTKPVNLDDIFQVTWNDVRKHLEKVYQIKLSLSPESS
uniref:Interferon-induced very large GTPase 1-like n=1 Tax=Erpetoichthys calabaricus TaxID=27687 RepID=A0A8C4SJ81_ERPCA